MELMPLRFMIDIETLSTRPNAHILSIGMVTITPLLTEPDEKLNQSFYSVVSPIQDRHIDPITVQWWMQDPQREFFPEQKTANSPLTEVLYSLNSVVRRIVAYYGKTFKGDDVEFWAKGTDFDYKILAEAHESLGIEIPWKYNSIRDCRTLFKRFPEVNKDLVNPYAHSAFWDAKFQALQLINVLRHIETLEDATRRYLHGDKESNISTGSSDASGGNQQTSRTGETPGSIN